MSELKQRAIQCDKCNRIELLSPDFNPDGLKGWKAAQEFRAEDGTLLMLAIGPKAPKAMFQGVSEQKPTRKILHFCGQSCELKWISAQYPAKESEDGKDTAVMDYVADPTPTA